MAAFRFWKLHFTGWNDGNVGLIGLVDVELRAQLGGPDLTSAAEAVAKSSGSAPYYHASESSDKAFDNNAGTWFQAAAKQTVTVPDEPWPGVFIQWDFGAGQTADVKQIQLTAIGNQLHRTPSEFVVLGSNDGVEWTIDWALVKPGGWGTATRTFDYAAPTANETKLYKESLEIGYEPQPTTARLSAIQEETLYQVQPTVARLNANQNEILYQVLPTQTYFYSLQIEVLGAVEQGVEVPPPPPPAVATPKRRRMIVGLSRILDLVADPPPPVVLPDPITTLDAEAVSTGSVLLSFEEMYLNVRYEYRLDGGQAILLPISKLVVALTPNTEYDFEVRMIVGGGITGPRGPWSNVATARTWEEVRPDVPVIPVEPTGAIVLENATFTGDAPKIAFKPDRRVKVDGYFQTQPGNLTNTDYQYMTGDWMPTNWQVKMNLIGGFSGTFTGPAVDVYHDLANEVAWLVTDGTVGMQFTFRRKSDGGVLYQSGQFTFMKLAAAPPAAAFQIEDGIIAGMWTANLRLGANGILYHHTAPGPATPIGPYISDINLLSQYEIRVDADFVFNWEVNSGVGQWLPMGGNLFWGWDRSGSSYVAPHQTVLNIKIRRKSDGQVVKTATIGLEMYGNA